MCYILYSIDFNPIPVEFFPRFLRFCDTLPLSNVHPDKILNILFSDLYNLGHNILPNTKQMSTFELASILWTPAVFDIGTEYRPFRVVQKFLWSCL